MALRWFSGNKPSEPDPELPPAVPPRAPLWRKIGVIHWFTRKHKTPDGVESTTTVVVETPEATAITAQAKPVVSVWQKIGRGFSSAIDAFDNAMTWIATPFGVHIRDPRRRYAVLLGVFAVLCIVGALPIPYVPLVALGLGYVGVLAISRAWVVNEAERTAIVKKLRDDNPDSLPDLRWTALVSALPLLVLFPLLYMQVHRHFGLFKVAHDANFLDWEWFAIDKTYLKALPDWSILYGIHISSIDFAGTWGKHLVMLSRLTFDYILLQGLFRLLTIRAMIREAVAVVKTDPDVAVRVGKRAIPALLDKLADPDRAVRGAAANAITQLGDAEGMKLMSEALYGSSEHAG